MSNEIVVIAHNAQEMAKAQSELAVWADMKAAESLVSQREIELGLSTARANKWATAPLQRAVKIARQQHEFYRKIAAASRLGYVIVPNLDVDVFAIRTTKPLPSGRSNYTWATHEQSSNAPAIGEGRYESSLPAVEQDDEEYTNEAGKVMTRGVSWATTFKDVAFPITAVKPQILDDTARAMAHKVFDELGLAPAGARKKRHYDPMVVGRVIYRPRKKVVSFLITWWLTNTDLEIRP